MIQAQQNLVIE